ncbi:MAG: hypothetical protein HY679_09080 [Chloroflexi bacterium]|nr:hypothetical protein [Chloroflexota bacterium]
MTVLNRIAYFQNRRDEVPNQELAGELAATKNKKGIKEIAVNLWSDNRNVQSDCLKVLYEIGYLEPALIADYADDFLRLLQNRNNRLVWGSMAALAAIAELKAKELFPRMAEIEQAMENGSVITVDNGVLALARIASTDAKRRKAIFPYLLKHLATCRLKEVPQHAEKTLVAVNAANKQEFIATLEARLGGTSGSQAARVKRVVKTASTR